MSYFPFDTQVCSLKFGSWSYTKSMLYLRFNDPIDQAGLMGVINIDESQYISSTAWEIMSKTGHLSDRKYDCCPEVYQDITYKLTMKRYVYYPTMTLVLPCIMTAMLIILTFILPAQSGEKVGLSK